MYIYDIEVTYKIAGKVPYKKKLMTPDDMFAYMKNAFIKNPEQEQFWVILLDTGNHPLGRKLITMGTVNRSLIHQREAFRFAVRENACGIIFAHNHPSNNKIPSKEDIDTTKLLIDAGNLLGIPVLDHLVFIDDDYSSIRRDFPKMFNE